MGYKIEWGNNNNCIHIKYEGEVNLNDMITINRLISRDPRYNYLKFNISDFLNVTNLIMSKEDIEQLSTFLFIPSISNPDLKLCVVSNNSEIRKMILSFIDLMTENEWRVKLFNNFEEPKEWCSQE